MANIREFQTPQLDIRPSETGIDATAQGARRIGSLYDQVGQDFNQIGQRAGSAVASAGQVAVDYMDHRDISAGAANGAQLMADINKAWEDTAKTADPNNPAVADKFRTEVLEPRLDKFRQGFSTEKSQDWAERFVDTYRNHMFEKTTATMSALAGEAVKVNLARTVNGLASAVSVDPSGHSIDNAFAVLDHSIGATVDSSPNITATTGAAVKGEVLQHAKEQIVKSAVASMITKNPSIDLDAIQKKYGEYIKGDEMKMFQKAAQTQAKADMIQNKQLETYQRQQQERAANDAFTKSRTENITADDKGTLTINPKIIKDALDITRKYPEAGAGPLDTTIRFVESQQNRELKVVDDPLVKSDLMTRMFSADKPTTTIDLMKARAEGKISDHTFQAYHGLVQELEQSPLKGPIWQDTVGAVKGELVLSGVGMPGKDIPGESNYAKWAQTFIPQYLAKSRAGTLPPNALDVKDPTSMISQSMAPFKRTVTQRANDYAASLGGITNGAAMEGGATRKVGDTPVPAALGGVAALQYNPAKKQWRDQSTGTVYDSAGQPVPK